MKVLDLSAVLNLPNLYEDQKKVDLAIGKILETDSPFFKKLSSHYATAKSKRLRAAMVMASAQAVGSDINENVIMIAAAVELLHLGSLVHDDIIDKSDTRRGLPTANKLEGSDQAILFGDFLLARSCEAASEVSAECARLISRTITDLCDGESRELKDLFNPNRSVESLLTAITGKTAALFSASMKLGIMSTKRDSTLAEAFAEYGLNFGIMFQLIDDLLDFISSTELFGKPVGEDIETGNYSHSVILALKSGKANKIKASLENKTELSNKETTDELINSGAIEQAIGLIVDYCLASVSNLANLKKTSTTKALVDLPSFYIRWSFDSLVDDKHKSYVGEILSQKLKTTKS